MQAEERFQVFVVRRLEDILPPEVVWTAVEQGVKLSGATPEQRERQWQRLVNKGVRRSVTDLNFWWPHPGGGVNYLALEMKWGKNTATDGQKKFMGEIERAGGKAAVAWTASQVEQALRTAGVPMNGALGGIDARLAVEAPEKPRKASKPRQARPRASSLKAMARSRAKGVFA